MSKLISTYASYDRNNLSQKMTLDYKEKGHIEPFSKFKKSLILNEE